MKLTNIIAKSALDFPVMNSINTVEELSARVIRLHKDGAYHRRRGFKLNDANEFVASNHLLEECVELQAEMQHGNHCRRIEESADVLCVFLHLLYLGGVPLSDVVAKAQQQLDSNFTLLVDEIETDTPAFTKSVK